MRDSRLGSNERPRDRHYVSDSKTSVPVSSLVVAFLFTCTVKGSWNYQGLLTRDVNSKIVLFRVKVS